MDLEDLEPRKWKDYEIGIDLSQFSIEDLRQLATTLGSEIERIEEALQAKLSSRNAAQSVFKS